MITLYFDGPFEHFIHEVTLQLLYKSSTNSLYSITHCLLNIC